MDKLDSTENVQSKRRVRILIADDYKPLRKILKAKIAQEKDLLVVGEAVDGVEAVKLAREIAPDVIIMDINMPHKNGIVATKEITTSADDTRIIGLSFHNDEIVRNQMLNAGAVAFLSKSDDMNRLCSTIRKIANKNFAA